MKYIIEGGFFMSKLSKGYLATLKGKKVIFKVVKSNPDLKVQFVDKFPDYKVKILNKKSFAKETITIQIVDRSPDVKLQRVDNFADFEVFID